MKTLKFLIAHENPVFRNILKRYLEQRGCQTYEAQNAAEARTVAAIEHPDVLIARETPSFQEELSGTPPGFTRRPLTIFLSESEGLTEADQATGEHAKHLSKGEFLDMLTLGGPILFAFMVTLLQKN